MPLTPEDVSNKRFTPVRLREGYDMGEVDQFLDEVEAELARLLKENDDLRERLRVAEANPPAASSEPADTGSFSGSTVAAEQGGHDTVTEQVPAAVAQQPTAEDSGAPSGFTTPAYEPAPVAAEPAAPAEPEPAPVAAAAVAEPAAAPLRLQDIRVSTVPEASAAAAKLLEVATTQAESIVNDAQAESEQILSSARTQAQTIETESRTRADQLEAEARQRAQMLDTETSERRTALFGDLDREKTRLNGEIENLRAFEREYRSRLKSYFTQQLAALDTGSTAAPGSDPAAGSVPAAPAGPAATPENGPADYSSEPRRLRSLLSDEEY